jgi:hypothetical protein
LHTSKESINVNIELIDKTGFSRTKCHIPKVTLLRRFIIFAFVGHKIAHLEEVSLNNLAKFKLIFSLLFVSFINNLLFDAIDN